MSAGAAPNPHLNPLFIKVKANKNDFSSALINGVKKMTTNRIDGSMNIAMSGGEAMAAP
ncbi:hypothetical protein TIA1EST31_11329 [Cutibacterium acnes FZ1/2/0]|nr:hypothetical protein TIA1EST31_11329 [Cutibacterium acnes FZ1/2/0]